MREAVQATRTRTTKESGLVGVRRELDAQLAVRNIQLSDEALVLMSKGIVAMHDGDSGVVPRASAGRVFRTVHRAWKVLREGRSGD
jgi:hypothetical protein